jgi:hypothetical protein
VESGQTRAHTGKVGVGVGVGRASVTGRGIVRPAASALASLHAVRTGTGWLGYTASAGPRLLSWVVQEWEMEMAAWAGLGFEPGFGPQSK